MFWLLLFPLFFFFFFFFFSLPVVQKMERVSQTICVTGATGYLAGHVIVQLLERGHRVRGTMRSAKDTKRVQHLLDAAKRLSLPQDHLAFFSADLTQPNSFDEAVQGCDGVIHIANVVQLSAKVWTKQKKKDMALRC